MEELKEEFQKRLGASDRTIESLKVNDRMMRGRVHVRMHGCSCSSIPREEGWHVESSGSPWRPKGPTAYSVPPFCSQDEKAKLQQALSQVNAGNSASEAQITEMTETIESLRWLVGMGGNSVDFQGMALSIGWTSSHTCVACSSIGQQYVDSLMRVHRAWSGKRARRCPARAATWRRRCASSEPPTATQRPRGTGCSSGSRSVMSTALPSKLCLHLTVFHLLQSTLGGDS